MTIRNLFMLCLVGLLTFSFSCIGCGGGGGGEEPVNTNPNAPTPQIPQKPSNIKAVEITGQLARVTWNDNSDNETGFIVQIKRGSNTWSELDRIASGATSYIDWIIATDVNTCYRVAAYNKDGESSYTDKSCLTISLPIVPPDNAPPVANDGEYSTNMNTPVTFDPPVDDINGNLEPTCFTTLDLPAGHAIKVSHNGMVTYTPPLNFAGVVRFEYSICDSYGAKAYAWITINVKSSSMSLTAESGVRAVFYKNGNKFYNRGGGAGGGRGFNIAVFDSITGELIDKPKNFDTWAKGAAGQALADYINYDVPMGAIVMIVVGDSAGSYGEALMDALRSLGATMADDIGWRHTWAMIAIKGQGTALDEARARGQWSIVSATADIVLDLEDKHGDAIPTATTMAPNNAEAGYLHEGEKDMFRLVLPEDGILKLSNTKPDKILMVLRNKSGEAIASSVDYQQFADKSIKRYLDSGEYYVEVGSSNSKTVGSFVLKSRHIIDPPLPVDLTFTALSDTRSNFAVNGEVFAVGGRGFVIVVVDPYTRHIDFVKQRFDTWGKGEAAASKLNSYINGLDDGSYLLLAVGDSAGSYESALDVLRGLGATMADDIGWRDTWAMIAIKGQGIALDEVRARGQWVEVTAEHTITVPGYDIPGESFEDAEIIEVNSLTPGYLYENDADVYLIALAESKSIRLESKGSIDTMVSLYVKNTDESIVLHRTEDHGGTGRNFLLQDHLAAGTYYIEVTGHGTTPIGQYDLIVTTE